MQKISVVLITGFLGAGKTTAIRHWLGRKPNNERWSILVNEFGQVGIDGTLLRGSGSAKVVEIAGGCICCTSGPMLRVSLNRLIREKPDKIIIEPTGLASPTRIVDLLSESMYRSLLEISSIVTLVDIGYFVQREWVRDQTYVDQVNLADILVGNKMDTVSGSTIRAFEEQAANLFPPKRIIATTRNAELPIDWAEIDAQRADGAAVVSDLRAPERSIRLVDPGSSGRVRSKLGRGDPVQRFVSKEGSLCSFGLILSAEFSFSLAELDRFFEQWALWINRQGGVALRGKGVFRCGSDWWLFNWSAGQADKERVAWRKDSRIELIAEAEIDPAWADLERALLSALSGSQTHS